MTCYDTWCTFYITISRHFNKAPPFHDKKGCISFSVKKRAVYLLEPTKEVMLSVGISEGPSISGAAAFTIGVLPLCNSNKKSVDK